MPKRKLRSVSTQRYRVKTTEQPFTRTLCFAVIDAQSDNEDMLVYVDPDNILKQDNARTLANLIATAMSARARALAVFEPEYPEE